MITAKFALRTAIALLLVLCGTLSVVAQTITSGTVIGTISDPTGAVVPKAEVTLTNTETNATSTQVTNDAGGYAFPNVAPGTYKITVKMAGFRTASVPNVIVEVNKSTTQSIALEVGGADQVVEVTTSAVAQLQTTDSQIGNAITVDLISKLPSLQRNVTELMSLQPGVYSTSNGTANSGSGIQMRTTGAIDDQNTVTIDGIDITQGVVAYNTVVPTGADSVEEFRANVANPNATMNRSSGGQMALTGRRGTNTLHGSAYWYRQDSVLNANTWDNNHAGIAKPPVEDNRFGGRVGGPIIKNKTFIFGNYEGRLFDAVTQVNRTVPTDSLKAGTLKFVDSTGAVQSFNFNPSKGAMASICGASGNQACDPRGIGISPTVSAMWNLMPAGNLAGGDGLNSTGYLANVGTPIRDDYGVARIDHMFSEKLTFNGSFTYFRHIATGSTDLSLIGASGGSALSLVSAPQRGSVTSGSLTYQIRPTLLNVFRFGYVHDTNASQATTPTIAAGILSVDQKVPGIATSAGPVAPLIGSGVSSFLDSPIDMDTQRARFQANYNGDWQYIDDMTWIKGKHTMQYGGTFRKLPYTHIRADKVIGSLSSLSVLVDAVGGFGTIPATDQPLTCSGSVTTNCVRSTDLTFWNRYYASTLGIVDNTNILAVRDANFKPTPFGTNLINITNQYAYYFYWQDIFRISKSLTVNYGVSYGWQTPPSDIQGRQTVEINAGTGQLVNGPDYIAARLQAAQSGSIYNPTLAWTPVANAPGGALYSVDYGNLAPRISAAWNPGGGGLIGKLMGEQKTVIRGGFAMIYDRSNIVQSVLIPMLGIGFGQTINIQLPTCSASGTPGAGCNAALGQNNPGASGFRLGVDGTIPLPPFGATTPPVIPGRFGETLSFQDDPNNKVGKSYNVDLSIQRELKGGFILDAAFVGRYGRRLPMAVNFTQAPYMQLDTTSNQTFAQAYDAVATQLRSGVAASAVANQPFFENQFPGLAAKNGAASATKYIAGANAGNFINGNLSQMFQNLGTYRESVGLAPYSNEESQTEFMRTYVAQSNYNGLLVNLSKRMSRGLQFQVNYTFSKAMDDGVVNQNQAAFFTNSFHPGVDYGRSGFDRTHVFNANFIYNIPAGKGHLVSGGKLLDRVLGGWYMSGIYTAFTGVPLLVTESSQVWGDDAILGGTTGAIQTAPLSTGMNGGVIGSGGVGTIGGGASGTGLNLFSNPQTAFAAFRPILLATDTRTGRGNPLTGLGLWNFDMSVGKDTNITERLKGRITFDFFNIFNHPNFRNPTLNLQSPSNFGVITSQFIPANRTNGARWIEIGLRLEF